MAEKTASRSCCSFKTLLVLMIFSGISVATYQQYPEKVQQVYDNLPPQVIFEQLDVRFGLLHGI